jgi:hypothetical protein
MLEFRTEAVRNFLDAVHDAFPASAKTGILESHTDTLRQQPFRKTDRWQAFRTFDHVPNGGHALPALRNTTKMAK